MGVACILELCTQTPCRALAGADRATREPSGPSWRQRLRAVLQNCFSFCCRHCCMCLGLGRPQLTVQVRGNSEKLNWGSGCSTVQAALKKKVLQLVADPRRKQ